MLRKLLFAGAAAGVIVAFIAVSQPVAAAGSCAVVTAVGRGADQAHAAKRAQNHLTSKISHWAHKNGVSKVRVGKPAQACGGKALIAHCKVSAKVCS